MERCPSCNARLRGQNTCSRCKADLNILINTLNSSETWLAKAIQYWANAQIERSINALELSLTLKKSQTAITFRCFIINQQSEYILALLAKQQLLPAKQALYKVRRLLPYSHSLQKIRDFSDSLYLNQS